MNNEHSLLLKQAFQLRKEKKISEALDIYRPLWQQHASLFAEWELWGYGQCLKEQRHYQEALDICRQAYLKYPGSELIMQLYAWCVYYTQLAGTEAPANYNLYKKAVDAIVKLSPPNTPYSPATRSIFKFVKWLAAQGQPNWFEIQSWLAYLDKNKLAQDTYSIDIPGKNKKVEMASDVEEWYSWQSKCCLQLKQWQECIDICNQAETQIQKWHYSNKVWFGRRKAAAMAQLGQKTEATELLEKLLKEKREWFMLADLAQLTADDYKALQLYAEAALAWGEPKAKVGMYFQMAERFFKQNNDEMAQQHALLTMALRRQNNWPIPANVEVLVSRCGPVPLSLPASQEILAILMPAWKNLFGAANSDKEALPIHEGKIHSLLSNGAAGFIAAGVDGDKIYFLFKNYRGKSQELITGLPVTYEVVESFDTKKQKPSRAAVRVRKR